MEYSLNDYTSRNPLNERIAENMLDLTLLQEGYETFEMKACFCFTTAYEICKQIIEGSPISPWKVPDIYKKATYGFANGDLVIFMKAVTISIVLILAEHFDENWQHDNQKFLEKLKDGLNNLLLSEEKNKDALSKNILRFKGIKSACISAYETLRRGTGIDYIIPFEEFSNQSKNNTGNTGASEEKSLTREEIKKLIEDTIKDSFDKHKKEIDEEESITNEDIKKAWEQALTKAKAEIEGKIPRFVYDEKNEGLRIITGSDNQNNGNNESLKDIIKTTVKNYLVDNYSTNEDIDEIFTDVYGKDLVEQVNRELSTDNNDDEVDEQTNQLPSSKTDESLRQQLADAQKTIKEQAQTINEQQSELKRLGTLNEVLAKQNARYIEENPEMDIDEDKALSIKESIIFFSSIMDCSLNKDDISQTNLARLISKITRWPKESIRPQIVDINTERENNAKNHTAFSDGVHQAAVNVCALIENAMTGLNKNPLPYSCKQALENIRKIYQSPGSKIEIYEIAEAKKNLKKL